MTTWPKRDKDGRHVTSADIPTYKSAAQREWELETRIKKLEGNDLDSLVSEFSDNIDTIVNKAVSSLDEYNNIAKMRNQVVESNRVINGLSVSGLGAIIQANYDRSRLLNTGMYGNSCLQEVVNYSPFGGATAPVAAGWPTPFAGGSYLLELPDGAALNQALGVNRSTGW
jgi:hypothetical protein